MHIHVCHWPCTLPACITTLFTVQYSIPGHGDGDDGEGGEYGGGDGGEQVEEGGDDETRHDGVHGDDHDGDDDHE